MSSEHESFPERSKSELDREWELWAQEMADGRWEDRLALWFNVHQRAISALCLLVAVAMLAAIVIYSVLNPTSA